MLRPSHKMSLDYATPYLEIDFQMPTQPYDATMVGRIALEVFLQDLNYIGVAYHVV